MSARIGLKPPCGYPVGLIKQVFEPYNSVLLGLFVDCSRHFEKHKMEGLFESKRNSAIQLSESGRSINIMKINSSKRIQVGGFI